MKEESIEYKNMLNDYLAGFLENDQKVVLEKELASNKTLRDEKEKLELSLEAYASIFKKTPEKDLSNLIWEKINIEKAPKELKVHPVSERPLFTSRILRIAASIVFLLSVLGNIYFSKKVTDEKEKFHNVVEEKRALKEQLLALKKDSELAYNEVELLKNPSIKLCKLLSPNLNENSSLLLGIDLKDDMQVMVLSPNLPQKESDYSYQLWAVSETGKKTCLGTFDSKNQIYKMKKLPFSPKEFGVTIEKGKYGQPQPTSDFLVRGI